ncbi:hypothetical protein NJC38_17115 [Pseudomonas sp. 21LCFQ010]|uniref:hypothetical protein n=1 Tax=Pseudomonas sp. 21LCFQ010 TaxID=2957506 RepID=UPI0020983C0E|nr:hypothetical protein [Pseudomonas sp. 21LCFQ010]MCO8163876.1 hypothetical protein [Pseudomonas sp. 21LCFQ010]
MIYEDIDLENLLGAPEPVVTDVINPMLEELPWEQMHWKSFQMLCAQMIELQYIGFDTQVFQYGKSGQAQEGIDIIWRTAKANKYSVAEVKHWRSVKPSSILSWQKKFLNGQLAKDSRIWFLCASINIENNPKLVKAWHLAKAEMESHGIQAVVWDRAVIEKLLRDNPKLVQRFFSKEIRDRFCYTLSMPTEDPTNFRHTYISESDHPLTVENESVRMEVILPNRTSPHVSAILSFARSNLAGVSLAIDGDNLVRWLQWAGHTHNSLKNPFTLPLSAPDRFLLTTSKFQLSLNSKELEQLDWCLKTIWTHYFSAVETLESAWRSLRFKRLNGTSQQIYALVSLPRSLWIRIMEYVSKHDYARGESDEHIFDASNSALKIFSPTTTTAMDAGYHLISYAYDEGGPTGRYEPNVIIGWNPNNLRELSSDWGPRGQWDAEFTHDWLFSTLLPKVINWHRKEALKKLSWLKNPVQKLTDDITNFSIDDHAFSLAQFSVRNIVEATTTVQLTSCLHSMQLHFSCLSTQADIEYDLLDRILRCIQNLAHRLPEQHHNYIRSNLRLNQKPLIESLTDIRKPNSKRTPSSTMLDMPLRSLICCIENSNCTIDDLKWTKNMLQPVWKRMRENLLCETFH